jgi:hypothetical protein
MTRPHPSRSQTIYLLLLSLDLFCRVSSTSARQVAIRPPEDVLKSAEVVAIASIVKVTTRNTTCDLLTEIVLRPQQALRGQLSPSMKEVRLLINEHKSAEGCISVSEIVPPVARTRAVGAKVIITIEHSEALKVHRTIASFELAELEKIQGILKRLPPPRPSAGAPEIKPRNSDDLRWVEETLQQMDRDQDFQRLTVRFGTSPRKNGSYTEVTPHSPHFATVLLLDERRDRGGRTQRVTVGFVRGQMPRVSSLERLFGRAKKAPPMPGPRGRSVTWTRIIHLGQPRLKRGQGRIVLTLEGGPDARLAREVTIEDYVEK